MIERMPDDPADWVVWESERSDRSDRINFYRVQLWKSARFINDDSSSVRLNEFDVIYRVGKLRKKRKK